VMSLADMPHGKKMLRARPCQVTHVRWHFHVMRLDGVFM